MFRVFRLDGIQLWRTYYKYAWIGFMKLTKKYAWVMVFDEKCDQARTLSNCLKRFSVILKLLTDTAYPTTNLFLTKLL